MKVAKLIDTVLSYVLWGATFLGYFVVGFAVDAPLLLSLAMGLGLAFYAVLRWRIFIAPSSRHHFHPPWQLLYEIKLMLISATGFFVAGWGGFAAAFVAGILIHVSLGLARRK